MNKIKETLAKKGLKGSWLADQIGCHPTEISQWISGRRKPNLTKAIKVANVLNCSVEELFLEGEENDN